MIIADQQCTLNLSVCWLIPWCSLVPRPSPSFLSLVVRLLVACNTVNCPASDEKLGEGLGMRLTTVYLV